MEYTVIWYIILKVSMKQEKYRKNIFWTNATKMEVLKPHCIKGKEEKKEIASLYLNFIFIEGLILICPNYRFFFAQRVEIEQKRTF